MNLYQKLKYFLSRFKVFPLEYISEMRNIKYIFLKLSKIAGSAVKISSIVAIKDDKSSYKKW